jgi:hypothetical protein
VILLARHAPYRVDMSAKELIPLAGRILNPLTQAAEWINRHEPELRA